MSSKKRETNVWNKTQDSKPIKNTLTPAEIKFKEAHQKLQAAVKKHVKDYESSSEEEELESENIIGLL